MARFVYMARFAMLWAALAAFFGWYARIEVGRYPVAHTAAWSIYACFMLLAGLYLAPGFAAVRARLKRVRAAWIVVAFLAPYLIYSFGARDFRWIALAKLAALAIVPLGVFVLAPVRECRRMNWQDGLALLWLYFPVQFHLTTGIWNVPVNLDFMARLFVVGVGAWAFVVVRGIEDAGYDFVLSGAILRDAAVSFLGFSMIGIPLGLAMRFIAWNPRWRGGPQFAADYVTLLLFVAIAEELFFRGLLQNLLEGSIGARSSSRNVAQAMVSVAFGFSHIAHAPAPNWRYVVLATIAGWFYGLAYRKHRSLMASAGCHALVDTVWRTFLTAP